MRNETIFQANNTGIESTVLIQIDFMCEGTYQDVRMILNFHNIRAAQMDLIIGCRCLYACGEC